ncbi:uncharacterized protein DUF2809 [Mucilaginibacter gracilis]|uniref:Uncharacterized protein DUF2809 n=1 Tax=Mucilaginibacter gracilis TaxID=423350 RepID=A0A495J3S5_9SPHI|nr:DUF2809 domain-containing protein [Mucilaginibacter gracilis]RKR83630.1 uncharacterized protein DUF2809 [Mucilaginibacter gracilis]
MNYKYTAFLLFLTEVIIGRYIHDTIIRPYIGDLLVAILIYCIVKSLVNTPVFKTAVWVLVFCYLVEVSQYFNLIGLLGWQNSKLAHIILGSHFSWIDMLCYTIGILLVLVVERLTLNLKTKTV